MRDLPWRKDYIPYHVWIAEVMGQQTQMDRVVFYFKRWIERFPSVESVAAAEEQAILKSWEGLGYYSRARNMHKAARMLLQEFNGELPATCKELMRLPGVGPYTAAAIMSIGFNLPQPVLDANVERIFSRLFDINVPLKKRAVTRDLHQMAEELLVRDNARMWNQALMEFGALVCMPGKPNCPECRVKTFCRAWKNKTVQQRPVIIRKKKIIDITMACAIIQKNGCFFIQRRHDDDLWGGLWEFPGGKVEQGETPESAVVREIAEETEWQLASSCHFKTVVHYFTRYRVTLHGFLATLAPDSSAPVLHAASDYAWVPVDDLSRYPFPSGHKKLVQEMKQGGFVRRGKSGGR